MGRFKSSSGKKKPLNGWSAPAWTWCAARPTNTPCASRPTWRNTRSSPRRSQRKRNKCADPLGRLALLFLLQREDRGIAAGPVRRHQAGLRIVVRPRRALAANDGLVLGRADRVHGVGKCVGRGKRVEKQRPAEVRAVLRRIVQRAAVVDRERSGRPRQ